MTTFQYSSLEYGSTGALYEESQGDEDEDFRERVEMNRSLIASDAQTAATLATDIPDVVTFDPDGGTIDDASNVTLVSSGADTIYFTADGSLPQAIAAHEYSAPFTLDAAADPQNDPATHVVRAFAVTGLIPSAHSAQSFDVSAAV